HLSAQETFVPYQLRAGQIRQVTPFWRVRVLGDSVKRFATRNAEQGAQQEGEESRRWCGGDYNLWNLTCQTISNTLQAALSEGHGGAIVIFPSDTTDSSAFNI